MNHSIHRYYIHAHAGTVNKAGDTPLSLACANGHLDTVKYLVNEHRCDPRSKQVHTYSIFHLRFISQFNYASAVHFAVHFCSSLCSSLLQFTFAVHFCSSLLQFTLQFTFAVHFCSSLLQFTFAAVHFFSSLCFCSCLASAQSHVL